jgi:hypothetical protein
MDRFQRKSLARGFVRNKHDFPKRSPTQSRDNPEIGHRNRRARGGKTDTAPLLLTTSQYQRRKHHLRKLAKIGRRMNAPLFCLLWESLRVTGRVMNRDMRGIRCP